MDISALKDKILVERGDMEKLALAYQQGDDAGMLWILAKYVSVNAAYINIIYRMAAWFFFILWLFTVWMWAFLLLIAR